MTTIAYKDGVLSADGYVTLELEDGNFRILSTDQKKIYYDNEKDIYYAYAGSNSCQKVVNAYITGYEDLSTEIEKMDESSEVLIYLCGKGKLLVITRSGITDYENSFHAIGSGGPYALGAMAAGKSSSEAVAVASNLDVFTGGLIHSVNVEKRCSVTPKQTRKTNGV